MSTLVWENFRPQSFPANQPLTKETPQYCLEHAAQEIAPSEPAMPVRYIAVEREAAEPLIRL